MLGRVRTRGWVNWIALVAWMVAIYVFSDQPDLPAVPGRWLDFAVKKLLHAAGYGVLAGLWWRALAGVGLRHPFGWAFVLTVTYAFSDEWHQTLVPGRTGRLRDVAIDAAGALIALAWLRGRMRRGGRSQ
jgi:VanZ family protein